MENPLSIVTSGLCLAIKYEVSNLLFKSATFDITLYCGFKPSTVSFLTNLTSSVAPICSNKTDVINAWSAPSLCSAITASLSGTFTDVGIDGVYGMYPPVGSMFKSSDGKGIVAVFV